MMSDEQKIIEETTEETIEKTTEKTTEKKAIEEEAAKAEKEVKAEEPPVPEKKKKEFKFHLEKKDWILAAIIVCVALLAFLLHEVVGSRGASRVTVRVDGELQGTYSLAEDQEIPINGGTNLLVIKNGKADMIEADCPDQLCVHQKAISLNHESIICLPNKVIAEVNSSESSELDAVTN